LRPVQNSQDQNSIPRHLISGNVRRIGHYQFPRIGDAPGPAYFRMLCQQAYGLADTPGHVPGSNQIILGNVPPDMP